MTQRRAGKARSLVGAWVGNQERGLTDRQRVVFFEGHFRRQLGDFRQQFLDLCRFGAVVQRGNQLNGFGQFLKVGLELGFHVSVEHCSSLS